MPVDPGLLIGEVGAVTAELAGGAAEGVQRGVAGVASFEGQVEGLAEVLGEEPVGVDAMTARRGVGVLEDALARTPQPLAEFGPGFLQGRVVRTVTEGHAHAPSLASIAPTTSHARQDDSSLPSRSMRGPMSSRSKPWL